MKKIDAFWDSSALVPLCVSQSTSTAAKAALRSKSIAVWWGTPIEVTSAFTRLLRSGDISQREFQSAMARLVMLRRQWVEIQPTDSLRVLAEKLLQQHALRSADALQLAAALIWAKHRPRGRAFVCFDGRLAEAARKEAFTADIV
ncbi:MAG: type II toxin-antitoxin system VapC family toxin [Bryobacterales bacterium]|nr:type II toxin-antitoxin system VapC family toxin [Bryobacterales bacterium]